MKLILLLFCLLLFNCTSLTILKNSVWVAFDSIIIKYVEGDNVYHIEEIHIYELSFISDSKLEIAGRREWRCQGRLLYYQKFNKEFDYILNKKEIYINELDKIIRYENDSIVMKLNGNDLIFQKRSDLFLKLNQIDL